MSRSKSTLVDPSFPQASSALVKLGSLLRPNWKDPVVVSTSFDTDIGISASRSESRQGRTGNPYRSIEFTVSTLAAQELGAMLNQMFRSASALVPVPLWTDFLKVTSGSTGTNISCAGQCSVARLATRRFAAGDRIIYFEPPASGMLVKNIQYLTFGARVDDNTVSVSESVTVAKGGRLYPLMECLPVLSSDLTLLNRRVSDTRIRFSEAPGPTALPPRQSPGTTPSGVAGFNSLPVLESRPDWRQVSVGVVRDGTIEPVGAGRVVDLLGDRAAWRSQFSAVSLNRAAATTLGQFFDSRCGRLHPFYAASASTDLTVVAVNSGTSIRIASSSPLFDLQNFRTLLCLEVSTTPGVRTAIFRTIVGWSRQGDGTDVVTLSSSIGSVSLSQILRATWACIARFSSDTLTETWLTDEIVQTDLSLVELVNEKIVDVDPPDISVGGTVVPWTNCVDFNDGAWAQAWYDDRSEDPDSRPAPPQYPVLGLGPVSVLRPAQPAYDVERKQWRFSIISGVEGAGISVDSMKVGVLLANDKVQMPADGTIDRIIVTCVSRSPLSLDGGYFPAGYLFFESLAGQIFTPWGAPGVHALGFDLFGSAGDNDTYKQITYFIHKPNGPFGANTWYRRTRSIASWGLDTGPISEPPDSGPGTGSINYSHITPDVVSGRSGGRMGICLSGDGGQAIGIGTSYLDFTVGLELIYKHNGQTYSKKIGSETLQTVPPP